MLNRPMRRAAAALLTVLLVSGCGTDAEPGPVVIADPGADDGTSGPLCDALPRGEEPGAPRLIADETAEIALTWIPVIMNFEASVRAAGMEEELREADGVTIFTPTDEAFLAALSQDTIDDLLLFRHDELRALLEDHIVDGELSLADLAEAGTVTARSGAEITITPAADGMVTLDDRSETVCGDYAVGNARIHVVDGMLGEMPEPAATEGPGGG